MVNVLNQGAEQPTLKETIQSFCEEVCEETKRYFTGVADVCVGTAWSTYAVACVLFAKANNLVSNRQRSTDRAWSHFREGAAKTRKGSFEICPLLATIALARETHNRYDFRLPVEALRETNNDIDTQINNRFLLMR